MFYFTLFCFSTCLVSTHQSSQTTNGNMGVTCNRMFSHKDNKNHNWCKKIFFKDFFQITEKKLKIFILLQVFLSCLINLKCSEQTSDLFKDIDIKKLFCNINEVFNCNLAFWQDYLHPIILDLTTSSSSTNSKNLLIDPTALVKGFSEVGDTNSI